MAQIFRRVRDWVYRNVLNPVGSSVSEISTSASLAAQGKSTSPYSIQQTISTKELQNIPTTTTSKTPNTKTKRSSGGGGGSSNVSSKGGDNTIDTPTVTNIPMQNRTDSSRISNKTKEYYTRPSMAVPSESSKKYKQSISGATKGYFLNLYDRIGQATSRKSNIEITDPVSFFLIDPIKSSFSLVGNTKGEQLTSPLPYQFRGTIDSNTYIPTLSEKKSSQEILAGLPVEVIGKAPPAQIAIISSGVIRDVTNEFQGLIDTRQLTKEQAEPLAQEKAEKMFTPKFEKIISLDKQYGDLYKTSGESFGNFASGALIAGGTLAASTNPIGASIIGGSLISASGIKSFASGLSVSKGDYKTGAKEFGEALLYGYGGSNVIRGTFGPFGSLAKEQTLIRMEDLQAQNWKFGGAEIAKSPKGDVAIKMTSTRSTGLASQELELFMPVFQQGGSKFSIAGGRALSTTRVVDYGLQGLVPEKQAIIKSVEGLSFVGKGSSGLQSFVGKGGFKIILPEEIISSVGRIDLIKNDKITRSFFGGVAKENTGYYDIISGKVKSGRFGPSGRSAIINPSSMGRIKLLPEGFIPNVVEKSTVINFNPSPSGLTTQQSKNLLGTGLISSQEIAKMVTPTIKLAKTNSMSPLILINKPKAIYSTQMQRLDLKPTTETKNVLSFTPVVDTFQINKQKSNFATPRTILDTKTITKQKYGYELIPALNYKLETKQEQVLTFKALNPQVFPQAPGFGRFNFDFGGGLGLPFVFPSGTYQGRKGRVKLTRKTKRTPSFGAVWKLSELGIKQPKFSQALEETGLFERAYIKPIELPNLGGSVSKYKKKKSYFL